MKWNEQLTEKLKELAFAGKSNQEIADTMQIRITDVYAKRSQLGITIDKVNGTQNGDSAIAPARPGKQADRETQKEPPENRTAPCGDCPLRGKEQEIANLMKLLKEVEGYVTANVLPATINPISTQEIKSGVEKMPAADMGGAALKADEQEAPPQNLQGLSLIQRNYVAEKASQQAVESIYQSILSNKETGISMKKRIALLESLPKDKDLDRLAGQAHYYAMEKMRTLLRFGLLK